MRVTLVKFFDWRGASPSIARADVPADGLTPDDYIVALFDRAATGIETERYRYFRRVRPR